MEILVFESSAEVSKRIIELITERCKGIVFYKAQTFEQALYILSSRRPDVVLFSLQVNVHATVSLLGKAKEANPDTVVIATYTLADEEIHRICLLNGTDHLFDKYTDFEKIPVLIETLTKKDDNCQWQEVLKYDATTM